jgi:hypothetical protein
MLAWIQRHHRFDFETTRPFCGLSGIENMGDSIDDLEFGPSLSEKISAGTEKEGRHNKKPNHFLIRDNLRYRVPSAYAFFHFTIEPIGFLNRNSLLI